MAWYNNDGLLVKFGPEEAWIGGGGEYRWNGPTAILEIDVRWNMLNAFGTRTILDETIRVPNGLLLQSAEFRTVVPFTSGGSATISFGMYDMDRTTAYAATGIHSALALTAMDAVNETTVLTGSLVSTILANDTPNLISATVGTANFTAGRGVLRLTLFKPTRVPAASGTGVLA